MLCVFCNWWCVFGTRASVSRVRAGGYIMKADSHPHQIQKQKYNKQKCTNTLNLVLVSWTYTRQESSRAFSKQHMPFFGLAHVLSETDGDSFRKLKILFQAY